jgi:putative membrane protein (TIGR04086 family)
MRNIRWGWIAFGGFLAEAAVFVIVIALGLLAGDESARYIAPPASFAATLAFGFWVARKARRLQVLHGALVGVVSMVIFLAMTLDQTQPFAYIVAHVLKVLGGAAGGFLALKRPSANVVSDARSV